MTQQMALFDLPTEASAPVDAVRALLLALVPGCECAATGHHDSYVMLHGLKGCEECVCPGRWKPAEAVELQFEVSHSTNTGFNCRGELRPSPRGSPRGKWSARRVRSRASSLRMDILDNQAIYSDFFLPGETTPIDGEPSSAPGWGGRWAGPIPARHYRHARLAGGMKEAGGHANQ